MNRRMRLLCWASILYILAIHIRSRNAAETSQYGYWLSPSLIGPQDCTTGGVADAGFYLVDPNFQYAAILVDSYSSLLFIARVTYVGQANLATNLDIYNFIGLVIRVQYKVYFFNMAGCPNVVYVPNDNTEIYSYRNLNGSFAYRAFDALFANCDYQCSTCPIAGLGRDPQQISFAQGSSTFVLRNIQSLCVVPFQGQTVQTVRSNVNSALQGKNIKDYVVTQNRNCINVVRQYPFLYSCPVNQTSLMDSYAQKAVLNKNYQQKNQFCSLVIPETAALEKVAQPIFGLYRIMLWTKFGSVIVISCYSLFAGVEFMFSALWQYCG